MARALVCGDLDSNDGYTIPVCVTLNNLFLYLQYKVLSIRQLVNVMLGIIDFIWDM